jgi:hypothetical protein
MSLVSELKGDLCIISNALRKIKEKKKSNKDDDQDKDIQIPALKVDFEDVLA